jgi:hypothetical protein
MSEETEKLTSAWRAAAARLIEAGYDPAAVYATMVSVGLGATVEREVVLALPTLEPLRPRTERPKVSYRLPATEASRLYEAA